MADDRQALLDRMGRYKFYHCIAIDDEITTPGVEDFRRYQEPVLRRLQCAGLNGKRVLDIGCRDGLFSFAAERLGAREVIGIDNDLSPAAIEFLIPVLGSRVAMHEMNLMDLTPERFGKFDVVVFAGVLYHLRYPFWALKLIRDVMNPDGMLIIETALYRAHEDDPLLYCPVDQQSPYEPTSVSFFNMKGLMDTLRTLGFLTQDAEFLNVNRPIDRGVLTCRYAPEIVPESLTAYWLSTHKRHTEPVDAPFEEQCRDLLLRNPEPPDRSA